MSSSVASQTSISSTTSTARGPGPSGGPGPGNGGGNGNGGGGGGGSNFNLAGSASLYLYTFLATLVLLLSVSAAIVVRSFILRRRHRLMVEEAIRNGTWVPPTPPTRAPRVDLSKKPALWEAYLGGADGGLYSEGEKDLGQPSGKGSRISTSWTIENSKDWEYIKPVYADYVATAPSIPYSGPTANLNSSPPVPIPVPAPITTLTPRGDEENQRAAQASTRPSFYTRAKMFLSPTPAPTSPLPASSSSAHNAANTNGTPLNISMTELTSSSPPTVRVAVLIAMPSPPPSHKSSSSLSASLSSSSSPTFNSNVPEPTTLHPLQPSSSQAEDEDEHPLPVLEMGVTEIAVGPSENTTTWDGTRRNPAKTTYSRGSSYAEP